MNKIQSPKWSTMLGSLKSFVEDIAAVIESLTAKGVLFETYEGMAQDEAGAWVAPDGTKVAWFKDPDQNME